MIEAKYLSLTVFVFTDFILIVQNENRIYHLFYKIVLKLTGIAKTSMRIVLAVKL